MVWRSSSKNLEFQQVTLDSKGMNIFVEIRLKDNERSREVLNYGYNPSRWSNFCWKRVYSNFHVFDARHPDVYDNCLRKLSRFVTEDPFLSSDVKKRFVKLLEKHRKWVPIKHFRCTKDLSRGKGIEVEESSDSFFATSSQASGMGRQKS